MKKSLIALAVMAAAGAASAQSSVQVYGLADVWFGSSKVTMTEAGVSESVRNTKLDSGGLNTSRIGFKGTEDLGGGLKANFQLEQGLGIDTGASNGSFNRQAWVGLSSGLGEVQLGKVWTSYDDIRSSANDTLNANIASSFSTWLGYSDRTNNGIKYISPVFGGGFSGSLTYAFGEDKEADVSASSVLSLGLQYANGPLFVGVAHQQQKQNGADNGVFSALPGFLWAEVAGDFETDVFGLVDLEKTTYNLINASYDFGSFKVLGGFNQVKQSFVAETDSLKAKEYNLGVEVPLSPVLTLAAGYSQSKVEEAGFDLWKTKGYSGALVYTLSKRTSVYAAATQTKLKAADGSGDGFKSQLYAAGINHKF